MKKPFLWQEEKERQSMAKTRSYTGGRFALNVDGLGMLGFVKKFSGGTIKGELATHNLGPPNIQKKHIVSIIYEPITVEVGMGMSAGFYEWIRATFDRGYVTKSGEIHACDFDYKSISVREFLAAQISEVTIPALDGSSKEPANMIVKFEPERIRYRKGDGSRIQGKIVPAAKKWLCSNFRFTLGNLPCSRVTKIDSFTWKLGVIKDELGQFRVPTKHPAKVEVPNLKLTISMADVEPWQDWHRSFVIEGQHAEGDELTGAITFLAPDLKNELAEIELLNVGIISLQEFGQESTKDEVARFTVELYVEKMTFNYKAHDVKLGKLASKRNKRLNK